MSRDPEDPIPPRRPKPRRPVPDPDPAPEEPTTFRPNPTKAAPSAKRPVEDSVFAPSVPSAKKKPATSFAPRSLDDPERVPEGPGWIERITFGSVGSGQLSIFCRQTAAYLDAGVDLRKALAGLQKQFARTALGPVLGRLQLSVKRGDAFAEAVAREPRTFDPLFKAMIKVAEARGGLPETLKMLSRHYEARQSLIRQARSAMIYPIVVLVVAAGVIALLTLFILPMFLSLLNDLGNRAAELPLPSRVLMEFSKFVQGSGWWLMPLVMIGGPILLFRIYRTKPGKQVMDRFALLLPGIGNLLAKIETTRFARTLSTLLGSGVGVGTSIELTADVMQLEPYQTAVRGIKKPVLEGEVLSEALEATRRFGADVISIVESGEETGKLPETLEHLADDYEEQVAYMVKNMGQLVQPLIMIMLGGVVLFIVLAFILPYVAAIRTIAGG